MTMPLRLARGCYLEVGERTLAERCAALLEVNPPDTVAVGTTAAALHDIWLPEQPSAPEFATCSIGRRPAEMTRSRKPQLRSHRRLIGIEDRTFVAGVPATTLARTWWDLAVELVVPDLVAAGDRALQLGCTLNELQRMVKRMARHRGSRRARQAVELLDARSRSRPESHLRVAVWQAGLDCFEVNEPIVDEYGQWLAEPDLSCARARIALEYQGIDHADPERMRRDITRMTDMRQRGWLMLLYGPAQVFARPWQIGPELRQLVRDRAPDIQLRPARSFV